MTIIVTHHVQETLHRVPDDQLTCLKKRMSYLGVEGDGLESSVGRCELADSHVKSREKSDPT